MCCALVFAMITGGYCPHPSWRSAFEEHPETPVEEAYGQPDLLDEVENQAGLICIICWMSLCRT